MNIVKATRKAYHTKAGLQEGKYKKKKWFVVEIPGETDSDGNPIEEMYIDIVYEKKGDNGWRKAKTPVQELDRLFKLYTSGGRDQTVLLKKEWIPPGEVNGNKYEGRFKYYPFNYQELYCVLSEAMGTPGSKEAPQPAQDEPKGLSPVDKTRRAHKTLKLLLENERDLSDMAIQLGWFEPEEKEAFIENINSALLLVTAGGAFLANNHL